MYRLFFIAKNNLKKKKGDVVVLAFLTMLAVTLLYMSITAVTNTGKVLDKVYEQTNGADFIFITPNKERETLTELISSQEEVSQWEVSPCLYESGVKYHRTGERKYEGSFCFGAMEETRNIQSYTIQEEGSDRKNSILLPYYFKAGFSYETGDTIYLTLGTHEYECKVSGFIEDGMFSTPLTASVFRCYLHKDYIEEIKEKEKGFLQEGCYEYKAKLKQGESSYKFEQKISEIITKEISEIDSSSDLRLNWETMKDGDAILSNIGMAIIMVFGVLLIGIAIIIIRFSVQNFIQNNLKNIGILQSMGYTSNELKAAEVLEMTGITLLGSCFGLLVGYLCGGILGKIQGILIGMNWQINFDIGVACITALLVNVLILFVTVFTVKVYGNITVLNALRGGVQNHNFRKNYIPLEKTNLFLQGALGLKNITKEKMKSLIICFIVLILSFSCCVGFALYQNFSLNTNNLVKLAGVNLFNIAVTGQNLEQVGEELLSWEEVEDVVYYSSNSIKLSKGKERITLTADFWREPQKLKNETLIEGRLPKYENEIVITIKVSELLQAAVGDVIYVEGNGKRKDYIVSGIDQKTQNIGISALMGFKGAERLNGTCTIKILYVCTKEGVTYAQMQKQIKKKYANLTVMDSEKMVENSISSVSIAMKLICGLFVTITLFVVCMVVMLLVKTKVVQEKRNFGIYKALGFTTRQLILQMVCSNLPIMLTGALLGAIASIYMTDSLVAMLLSFCGLKVCDMVINPVWLVVTVVGITVVSLVVTLCFSMKIRKIEPAKMLMSE